MKKMRKELGVFTAAVLLCAYAGQAGAFCVHNKSDINVNVDQSAGGSFWKGFSAVLAPGEDACCHWSNTDCNKSGEKFSVVKFNASIGFSKSGQYICSDVAIPACSDMGITGTALHTYTCIAHGAETCN
jgi:hypothetical protein